MKTSSRSSRAVVVAGLVLIAMPVAAHAAVGMERLQAPRGQDAERPRGQEGERPRGQDAERPRGGDSRSTLGNER